MNSLGMTDLEVYRAVRASVEKRDELIKGAYVQGSNVCAVGGFLWDNYGVRVWDDFSDRRGWLFEEPLKTISMKNERFRHADGTDKQRRGHMLAWLDQRITELEGGVPTEPMPEEVVLV